MFVNVNGMIKSRHPQRYIYTTLSLQHQLYHSFHFSRDHLCPRYSFQDSTRAHLHTHFHIHNPITQSQLNRPNQHKLNMAKRNPNRRRKSPRKSSAQNTIPDMHYHDTAHAQAGYQPYNMPGFSEESIQRQLGYMVPLPQPAGYLYTHTHPVTGEEVAVWYDEQYTHVEEDYSYGRKHEDGCERFCHQGDCYVRPGHDSPPVDVSLPPLYQYVEGYHDPILKDLAEDWWRLFGHDVPKQFILAPTTVEKPDAGSEPKKAEEMGSGMRRRILGRVVRLTPSQVAGLRERMVKMRQKKKTEEKRAKTV